MTFDRGWTLAKQEPTRSQRGCVGCKDTVWRRGRGGGVTGTGYTISGEGAREGGATVYEAQLLVKRSWKWAGQCREGE